MDLTSQKYPPPPPPLPICPPHKGVRTYKAGDAPANKAVPLACNSPRGGTLFAKQRNWFKLAGKEEETEVGEGKESREGGEDPTPFRWTEQMLGGIAGNETRQTREGQPPLFE